MLWSIEETCGQAPWHGQETVPQRGLFWFEFRIFLYCGVTLSVNFLPLRKTPTSISLPAFCAPITAM